MAVPDPNDVTEPLRANPACGAVLCDIDGTLAPIVDNPEAAAVPPAARAVLAELATRYRLVACVSGRRASAARRMVGLDELTYAGNHGLEVLRPGRRHSEPGPGAWSPGVRGRLVRIAPGLAESRRVGLRREDKGPDPGDPLARGRRR